MKSRQKSILLILALCAALIFTSCGGTGGYEESADLQPHADFTSSADEVELLIGSWQLIGLIDPSLTDEEIAEEMEQMTVRLIFMPFDVGIFWVETIGMPVDSDILPTFTWTAGDGLLTWTNDFDETFLMQYNIVENVLTIHNPEYGETMILERLPE